LQHLESRNKRTTITSRVRSIIERCAWEELQAPDRYGAPQYDYGVLAPIIRHYYTKAELAAKQANVVATEDRMLNATTPHPRWDVPYQEAVRLFRIAHILEFRRELTPAEEARISLEIDPPDPLEEERLNKLYDLSENDSPRPVDLQAKAPQLSDTYDTGESAVDPSSYREPGSLGPPS